MTVYVDASLVVAAFTEEVSSTVAERALADAMTQGLLASRWCVTEIASALGVKVRTGAIHAKQFGPLLDGTRGMLHRSATWVSIEEAHFDTATRFLERSRLPLRGGDALHLAIAANADAELWTLDRRMAEAGQALGLDARLLA